MYRMPIIVKKIGLKDLFICYICATLLNVAAERMNLHKPPQLIYSSRVRWFNRPVRDELEFWLINNFITMCNLSSMFVSPVCLCLPPPAPSHMSEYNSIQPLLSRSNYMGQNVTHPPTHGHSKGRKNIYRYNAQYILWINLNLNWQNRRNMLSCVYLKV